MAGLLSKLGGGLTATTGAKSGDYPLWGTKSREVYQPWVNFNLNLIN